MCIGHQYKEHLWKINSQRRVVDGINGQYIFRFSWKLLFQLEQKCKHQKGNLSQPLKLSQMLMGVKGKLMKKCEFRIQISSSLFLSSKALLQWKILQNEREFRYFMKEMTSPKFWPASSVVQLDSSFMEVAAMHQPSFQHLRRCNQLLYVHENDL